MFAVEFLGDGEPLVWELDGTTEQPTWNARRVAYRPTVYAVTRTGLTSESPDSTACRDRLASLQESLDDHGAVAAHEVVTRRPGFRYPAQPVCRIEVTRPDRVRSLAAWLERRGPPGQMPIRAFDVDLSPGFRFCLDRDVSPVPARSPTVLHLGLSRAAAAAEDPSALRVGTTVGDGPDAVADAACAAEPAGETARDALETLRDRLARFDPDVLSVERAALLPVVADAAAERGIDLGVARVPDGTDAPDGTSASDETSTPDGTSGSDEGLPAYRQLAAASTFESYGRRHHSPARYDVPGRVVIDGRNTFFLDETNLAGCLDLVERARKPLQELSWASIGNVLTAIQIWEARARDVLVQWHAWRPERFKSARTLQAADRGGTILSPDVGLHENVAALDFASLYPNLICEHNLSPETVRCRCHDRADVPELGYAVCDRDGYLPDVLGPIVDDRAAIKRRLADDDLTPTARDRLAGRSAALKWILVSCFGYQGFSNAKFGRIEVHEAINAYARDVLLTAKERLEAAGWRVLHGIVDSLWVTPRERDREPLGTVAREISEAVGIRLEHEDTFDWVAFCSRRDGRAGALTRYFGRRADGGYKTRGIECRQRSTPAWIADLQRDLLRVLDETRDPDAVTARLHEAVTALTDGGVSATDLLVRRRVSQPREAYDARTHTTAALARAERRGVPIRPGEDVRYLVVDDDADSADRVRIASEVDADTRYDADFYRTLAIRATASVLSPFGWSVHDVRDRVRVGQNVPLAAYDTA